MVGANLREISRSFLRESSRLRIFVRGVNAKKELFSWADLYMRLIITDITRIIYSMTERVLRAGYPTLLPWRGRYDLFRLKTNRCYHTQSENGSRVFTHSLDVN